MRKSNKEPSKTSYDEFAAPLYTKLQSEAGKKSEKSNFQSNKERLTTLAQPYPARKVSARERQNPRVVSGRRDGIHNPAERRTSQGEFTLVNKSNPPLPHLPHRNPKSSFHMDCDGETIMSSVAAQLRLSDKFFGIDSSKRGSSGRYGKSKPRVLEPLGPEATVLKSRASSLPEPALLQMMRLDELEQASTLFQTAKMRRRTLQPLQDTQEEEEDDDSPPPPITNLGLPERDSRADTTTTTTTTVAKSAAATLIPHPPETAKPHPKQEPMTDTAQRKTVSFFEKREMKFETHPETSDYMIRNSLDFAAPVVASSKASSSRYDNATEKKTSQPGDLTASLKDREVSSLSLHAESSFTSKLHSENSSSTPKLQPDEANTRPHPDTETAKASSSSLAGGKVGGEAEEDASSGAGGGSLRASVEGSVASQETSQGPKGWKKVAAVKSLLSATSIWGDIVLEGKKNAMKSKVEWQEDLEASQTATVNLDEKSIKRANRQRQGSVIAGNFQGLRRDRISSLIGPSTIGQKFDLLVLKDVDLQTILDRLLILKEPRRIAIEVLRLTGDVTTAVVTTIANFELLPGVSRWQQAATKLTSSTTAKHEGRALMGATLGVACMPPVCAAKILKDLDPALTLNLLDQLGSNEAAQVEKCMGELEDLLKQANETYTSKLQGLSIAGVVEEITALNPGVAAEIITMVEDKTNVHGMIMLLLHDFPTQAALILEHMNPSIVMVALDEVDEQLEGTSNGQQTPGTAGAMVKMLCALPTARATNLLEQLNVTLRSYCLRNMPLTCVVPILHAMETRKASDACYEMHDITDCCNILSAADELIAASLLQSMDREPLGIHVARLLAAMAAPKAASLLSQLPQGELRRAVLKEGELSFLVAVFDCVEKDQAVPLISEMEHTQSAAVMDGLPPLRAAGILEKLPLRTIGRVVSEMSMQAAAETLQKFVAGKAATVIDSIAEKDSAAYLSMMAPSKVVILCSNLSHPKVTQFLSLMPAHNAACILEEFPPQLHLPILRQMHPKKAADVLSLVQASFTAQALTKLDKQTVSNILHGIAIPELISIVEHLEVRFAANLIGNLEDTDSIAILQKMDLVKATRVLEIMDFQRIQQIVPSLDCSRLGQMIESIPQNLIKLAANIFEILSSDFAIQVLSHMSLVKGVAIFRMTPPGVVAAILERVELTPAVRNISELEPQYAGPVLSKLSVAKIVQIFTTLAVKHSATLLGHMTPLAAAKVVEDLDPRRGLQLMQEADEDMAVKAFNVMNVKHSAHLLGGMTPAKGGSLLRGMALTNSGNAAAVLFTLEKNDLQLAMEFFKEMGPECGANILTSRSVSLAASFLTKFSPDHMAQCMMHVNPDSIIALFLAVPPPHAWAIMDHFPIEMAGTVLAGLNPEYGGKLVEYIPSSKGKVFFTDMPSVDARNILQEAEGIHSAHMLEHCPDDVVQTILKLMPVQKAAKPLSYLTAHKGVVVLSRLNYGNASQYLDFMIPEAAAGILNLIPNDKAAQILESIPVKQASVIFIALEPENKESVLDMLSPSVAERLMKWVAEIEAGNKAIGDPALIHRFDL